MPHKFGDTVRVVNTSAMGPYPVCSEMSDSMMNAKAIVGKRGVFAQEHGNKIYTYLDVMWIDNPDQLGNGGYLIERFNKPYEPSEEYWLIAVSKAIVIAKEFAGPHASLEAAREAFETMNGHKKAAGQSPLAARIVKTVETYDFELVMVKK